MGLLLMEHLSRKKKSLLSFSITFSLYLSWLFDSWITLLKRDANKLSKVYILWLISVTATTNKWEEDLLMVQYSKLLT